MERKRRSTAVVSFSSDLETLNYLEAYSQMHRVTRSTAIKYHLTLGRTYLKILEEQTAEIANTAKNGTE